MTEDMSVGFPVDVVPAHDFPECAAMFPGALGSPRNVPAAEAEEVGHIFDFESAHNFFFGLVEP